ncbi:MAG TPA: amidohydrolase family protein, partial [Thermomicrobiales bacterium]|nr:amidohydrolase family protein [Thermomicrobiales bacterium]
MTYDLIVRGGRVVAETGVVRADVAVADGQIAAIAPEIAGSARETIDAAGLHLFPGVVDPHVHFNEPGRTEWEGWATGSAALAAGGGTIAIDMPLNSSPPTLDGASFDAKRAAAEASSRVDFALWGGLTPDNLGTLEELAARGVVGFKAFMANSGIDDFQAADDLTLYQGM